MPIPEGELRRMREEERRREAVHRRLRWERRKKKLFWLFLGVLLLTALSLLGPNLIPLLEGLKGSW